MNYFFYHLPTRGRVGIKLGDDARLQRIYNFLLLHVITLSSVLEIIGLYYSLYIIFGTNLLT